MVDGFKLNDLLHLSSEDLKNYNLHLAKSNHIDEPLDVFTRDFDEWVEWNKYRKEGSKNRFPREFIFSMINDYHRQGLYFFGGIFRIIETRHDGYEVELCDLFKPLIGRLIIGFNRRMGQGSAFVFKTWIDEMSVAAITEKPYGGIDFPGYNNVLIDFPNLEILVNKEKEDWKVALSNFKGVYLIADKSNGKKYIGSAYGEDGLWQRWCCYGRTGHGNNIDLVRLINEQGIDYARKNFQFSILEIYSLAADKNYVTEREQYWQKVLLSKGEFGYTLN